MARLTQNSVKVRRHAILRAFATAALTLAAFLAGCAGCASRAGRLNIVPQTMTPADTTGGHHPERAVRRAGNAPLRPLFAPDTLIGFQPGTGDSSRRFLGRLRDGYTADTLNIILLGDNRPGFRMTRLHSDMAIIRKGLSPNPLRFGRALIQIPIAFVKGMVPDLGLLRDIPPAIRGMPTWGREHQVLTAIMAKLDTLKTQKKLVAAAINTGDLVYDGQNPAHWERFLRIHQPLYSRVPYFAVAGNHEKTWTVNGLANWRTATGLPIAGDRMYYCFDSADGWVRFIALDSNPITMPGVHWSKEVQVNYSKEEVDWLTARLKEHRGPSFVFIHSPPFSAGYHRMEWDMDPIMQSRRDQIVRAMKEGGISVLAGGHEHDYERALLTFPDGSVLIAIVQGGAGAPLHPLPPPAEAARLFSTYKIAGGTIKPENVYTGVINNFTFLQLWFGGGELQTYAVYKDASVKLVDQVNIDLRRYGKPKIDQHKMVVAPTGSAAPSTMEAKEKAGISSKADTTAASQRIEKGKPPGKKTPVRPASRKRTVRRPSAAKPATQQPATPPPATHTH
jgi:calcineurin-like phosphoesterase family protein